MVGLLLFAFFAGGGGGGWVGVANLTQNNVKLQKIHLFSYSRKGFELS